MGRGGSVWGVQQPGNILHEVALQSCGNHEWDSVRGLKQPSNVLYAVAVLGCGHHAWGPIIMRLRCRAAAIWHCSPLAMMVGAVKSMCPTATLQGMQRPHEWSMMAKLPAEHQYR